MNWTRFLDTDPYPHQLPSWIVGAHRSEPTLQKVEKKGKQMVVMYHNYYDITAVEPSVS